MKPEIDIDSAITLLFFLLLLSVCISLSLGGMSLVWYGNRVFIDVCFLDIKNKAWASVLRSLKS